MSAPRADLDQLAAYHARLATADLRTADQKVADDLAELRALIAERVVVDIDDLRVKVACLAAEMILVARLNAGREEGEPPCKQVL